MHRYPSPCGRQGCGGTFLAPRLGGELRVSAISRRSYSEGSSGRRGGEPRVLGGRASGKGDVRLFEGLWTARYIGSELPSRGWRSRPSVSSDA